MLITAYEPWMKRALEVARESDPGASDPRAAAVIFDGEGNEVAAARHNRAETSDPTAHAEITVLRQAGQQLGSWRLYGYTLVTTLEPCTMCAGALVLAWLPKVVIGSWDREHGAVNSLWDVVRDRRLNHFVEVIPGVLAEDCEALLHTYVQTPPQR